MEYDRANSTPLFGVRTMGAVVAGLLAGGLIDLAVRKLQDEDAEAPWQRRKYSRAFAYFVIQASLNIALLLFLVRFYPKFTQWFQLSISGALFGVLLFSVQRNLADNALRITSI
jgi:hypothetical protein